MLMINWNQDVKPTKGWAIMYRGEIVYFIGQGKRVFSRKHLAENALDDLKGWNTRNIKSYQNPETEAMIKECTVEEV